MASSIALCIEWQTRTVRRARRTNSRNRSCPDGMFDLTMKGNDNLISRFNSSDLLYTRVRCGLLESGVQLAKSETRLGVSGAHCSFGVG